MGLQNIYHDFFDRNVEISKPKLTGLLEKNKPLKKSLRKWVVFCMMHELFCSILTYVEIPVVLFIRLCPWSILTLTMYYRMGTGPRLSFLTKERGKFLLISHFRCKFPSWHSPPRPPPSPPSNISWKSVGHRGRENQESPVLIIENPVGIQPLTLSGMTINSIFTPLK